MSGVVIGLSGSLPIRAPQEGDLTGRVLGEHRIVRKIGEGGMGVVYEARREDSGERAAIKVLHQKFSGDEKLVLRFLNEARAIEMVQHEGLVKTYNYGQLDDGTAYILMEYLEGESLGERLDRLRKEGARLPYATTIEIIKQVAAALEVTHQKGIVHRDLKPDNVFLVQDPASKTGERTKLLDFGIAKFMDVTGRKTTVGMVLGTPTYMAPEQCEGASDLDDRVDVYALGVMLYEMLAGQPPFEAESGSAVMFKHMFKEPRPIGEIVPQLPDDLRQLVRRMLIKDRRKRPSITEVRETLGQLQVDPSRWKVPLVRPRKLLPVLLGIAVVACGAWLGLAWLARPREVEAEISSRGKPGPALPPPRAPKTTTAPARPSPTETEVRPSAAPARPLASKRPRRTGKGTTRASAADRGAPESAVNEAWR